MNSAKKVLDQLTFHQQFDKLIKKVKLQMKVTNDENRGDDVPDNQKSKDAENDKAKAKQCNQTQKDENNDATDNNNNNVIVEQTGNQESQEAMTQLERLKAL